MKLGEGEVLLLVEKWLICGFWEISVVGGYFGEEMRVGGTLHAGHKIFFGKI